jgi:hypothetical protein
MSTTIFNRSGDGQSVVVGDPSTADTPSYTLASAIASLAGNTATTSVSAVDSGSYVWSYVLGGTTPSLILQTLGPDGTTWQNVATVTASGSQVVTIPSSATVRLLNNTANAITGLSSKLS